MRLVKKKSIVHKESVVQLIMSGFIRGIGVGIGISWLIAPMKGQELRHLLLTRWAEISGSTPYQELSMPTGFAIEEGKALQGQQEEPSSLDGEESKSVVVHELQESVFTLPLPQEQPENTIQEQALSSSEESPAVQAPPHSQHRKKRKRRATS